MDRRHARVDCRSPRAGGRRYLPHRLLRCGHHSWRHRAGAATAVRGGRVHWPGPDLRAVRGGGCGIGCVCRRWHQLLDRPPLGRPPARRVAVQPLPAAARPRRKPVPPQCLQEHPGGTLRRRDPPVRAGHRRHDEDARQPLRAGQRHRQHFLGGAVPGAGLDPRRSVRRGGCCGRPAGGGGRPAGGDPWPGLGHRAVRLPLVGRTHGQLAGTPAGLVQPPPDAGPLHRWRAGPEAARIGAAGDAGADAAPAGLGLVRAVDRGGRTRRAAGDRPAGAPGHAGAAQSAGRLPDGCAGVARGLAGPAAGHRRGDGLSDLAPTLDGRCALAGGTGLRPGADHAAGRHRGCGAPDRRQQRLRLPVGVGDHGHHHLRLLRSADRPRDARPYPRLAVPGVGHRSQPDRFLAPVPGRALAERCDRRHAVRHVLAAGAGHRLSPPLQPLVLGEAGGLAVLRRLRRGGDVVRTAQHPGEAGTLRTDPAGPAGDGHAGLVAARLGHAAGAPQRVRRRPALAAGRAGGRAIGTAAGAAGSAWLEAAGTGRLAAGAADAGQEHRRR